MTEASDPVEEGKELAVEILQFLDAKKTSVGLVLVALGMACNYTIYTSSDPDVAKAMIESLLVEDFSDDEN